LIQKPPKGGGLGPIWAVAPQERKKERRKERKKERKKEGKKERKNERERKSRSLCGWMGRGIYFIELAGIGW
jgi:hypothetical protein